MDQRLQSLQSWAARQLAPETPELTPVAGDASFRRYFRLKTPQASWIAMDAPPEKENSGPFIRIARHWHANGIHVPAVQAVDLELGFALLEDLGDTLYLQQLDEHNADRLYSQALETLLAVAQLDSPPDCRLPAYDEALLDREMALFRDWLCQDLLGLELSNQEQCLLDTTFALLREAALAQPQVTVHRDYHSRNLMVTPERTPGVIDFQDAVTGPITYDLVSLIKDCYIAWPQARRARWIEQYRLQTRAAGLHQADSDTFIQWTELMGMQRHLKAAGIFARLYLRDGKSGFLADIPRTLDYIIEASAVQPALRHLHQWLQLRVRPRLKGNLKHLGEAAQ